LFSHPKKPYPLKKFQLDLELKDEGSS